MRPATAILVAAGITLCSFGHAAAGILLVGIAFIQSK